MFSAPSSLDPVEPSGAVTWCSSHASAFHETRGASEARQTLRPQAVEMYLVKLL